MKLKALPLASLSLLGGLALGSASPFFAASSSNWSEFDSDSVVYGASASAPSMSYSSGGATYAASCIVTMPNGEEVNGDSLTYSLYGLYTFTYTVKAGAEVHSLVKTAMVPYPEFGVGDLEKSSISYLSAEEAAKYRASTPGTMVKLAYGDSITFTEPISVDELTASNVLLKGYIIPSTEGTADFSQLIITLTDINDPSIYVKELYYSHSDVSSIMAKSNAQSTYAGMHDSQGLHTNDTWGTWSGVSFIGMNRYNTLNPDEAFFTAGYDNKTKTVYGTKYSKGSSMDGQVLTLDSPLLTGAFEGFKSDKVRMSVSCEGYASSSANLVITDFRGKGSEAVKNNVYLDSVGPLITLEKEGDLPAGAISYDYPVPEASAFDEISGECAVTRKVVYNYANPASSSDVAIVDGRFKMDKPGVYSIVYSAKDYSGNESKLVKSVSVMEEIPAPDFDLPLHQEEAPIGSYLKLEEASNLRLGCGDLKQRILVRHGEVEEEVSDGIRLLELAPYTITYEVSDMIGMVSRKSYTVSVIDGKTPILENAITYPRYLISEGGYYLPESYAYYYSSGTLRREAPSITIVDASGSKDYKPGDFYRPSTSSGGKVKIKTSYNGVTLQEDEIEGVSSLGTPENESALNLNNYFLGEGYSKTLEKNGMRIASEGSNGRVDFANALLSSYSTLTLSQVMGMEDGAEIEVKLTSSLDQSKSISATLSYSDSITYLEVNGNKKQLLNNSFNTSASSYAITFEEGSFSIGDVSLPVSSYDDGTPFSGFASERAYLSLGLSCQKGSSFLFESICQYVFSSDSLRDRIAPLIYASDDLGGSRSHGSVYVIDPSYSFDVLSPLVEFSLSVTCPDGSPAKDINGIELSEVDPSKSYSLLLDQYGEYYFSLLSAEDASFSLRQNQARLTYVVRVYDQKAPSLSWTSTLPSLMKVGDSVLFPDFDCEDEVSDPSSLTIVRSIVSPSGRISYWYDDSYDGITFQYAGVYKFRVIVFDEAGNSASIEQSVTVEE